MSVSAIDNCWGKLFVGIAFDDFVNTLFMKVLFICRKVHSFPRASFRSEILENIDESVKLRFKSKFPNETLSQEHWDMWNDRIEFAQYLTWCEYF